MASIGWIDFSKKQKEQTLAVLDFLKPEGKVDELGVGIIRDAIADQLFPGISTIHTRAKYFFIIPNIMWEYSHLTYKQKKEKPLKEYLKKKENEIMYRLSLAYNKQEGHGVIGITKNYGDEIARPPSVIYWRAINTFRFINFKDYSLDMYVSHFSKHQKQDVGMYVPMGDDGPKDDAANNYENSMGIFTRYNKDFAQLVSLDLDEDEADDFSERILKYANESLLAELLRNPELQKLFFELDSYGKESFIKFAQQATQHITNKKLNYLIKLAHDFSFALYGANITYNQIIQRNLKSDEHFDELWEGWIEKIPEIFLNSDELHVESFSFLAPNLKPYTYRFLQNWFKLIREKDFKSDTRFILVEKQEYDNKKGKARIRHQKFDDCKKNLWLGFGYLDYRYNNAKTILKDIQSALNA